MQTLWSFLPSFPDQRVIAISRYIAIYIALGGTNQSINQSINFGCVPCAGHHVARLGQLPACIAGGRAMGRLSGRLCARSRPGREAMDGISSWRAEPRDVS